MDTEEDISLRNFTVLPIVPNEEYILSDSAGTPPSRLSLSLELKPEPEKSNCKYSEWKEIGSEEKLMKFTNHDEISEDAENRTFRSDTTPTITRNEQHHQGIKIMLFQTPSPINARQSIPNGISSNCARDKRGEMSNPQNDAKYKTREINNENTHIKQTLVSNTSPRLFNNRYPQPVYYKNTVIVSKRNKVKSQLSNFRTSFMVSSNTDLIRDLLQSSPSPSQHEKDKAKVKNGVEIIQFIKDPKLEPVDGENYVDGCSLMSSPDKFNRSNDMSKEKNVTETKIIEIPGSSEDEYHRENRQGRVSCSNLFSSRDMNGTSNLNTSFDDTKTSPADHTVFKVHKVKISTSNIDKTSAVSLSRPNLAEVGYSDISHNFSKEKCQQSPQENFNLKHHIDHDTSEKQGRTNNAFRSLMKLSSGELISKDYVNRSQVSKCDTEHSLSGNQNYSSGKQIVFLTNSGQNHEDLNLLNLVDISSCLERKFVCQNCSKSFKCESHLNKHLTQVHSEERNFVCSSCCKAYKNKEGLDYHFLCHHNPTAHKHRCKKCHKNHANEDDLLRHLRQAHSKTKISAPETCDICQKVFKSRQHMLNHKTRKHNVYSKSFICNDCSASFSIRYLLIDHIKKVHMPPEIKCPRCSEYFHTRIKLQAHLRQYHGEDDRKSFICETCGKIFKTSYRLEIHLKTHTDTKPYVCEDCGKTFRTITNLQQHSKIHSEIRPFSCNLCNSSFRIRHHLRQHMATHGMASTRKYYRSTRIYGTASDKEYEERCSHDVEESILYDDSSNMQRD